VLNRLYLENNLEIMMEPREKYVNVFFTREELTSNEDGKNFYGDIKNSMDTAFEEGKVEGKEEGKEEGLKEGKKTMIVEIIQNGVSNNMSLEILTQLTGLTEKEVLDIISTF
jgi:predicted transposase/invertase (TIGR01784 family)